MIYNLWELGTFFKEFPGRSPKGWQFCFLHKYLRIQLRKRTLKQGKGINLLRLTIMAIFLLMLTFPFIAKSASEKEDSKEKIWEIEFVPYVFLPNYEYTFILNGESISGESSIGDVLSKLNGGLLGRLEIWRKKWGFVFDGKYLGLGEEISAPIFGQPLLLYKGETKIGILDFFFSYTLLDLPFGLPHNENKPFRFVFQPYTGIRWEIFDFNLNFVNFLFVEENKQWVELAFGANMEVWLSQRWFLTFRGDASGFGIGNASDITWQFVSLLGYRFPKIFGLYLGYQLYGVDLSTHVDFISLKYEAFLHGPYLGFSFYY